MADFLLTGRVNTGQITNDIIKAVNKAADALKNREIDIPIQAAPGSIALIAKQVEGEIQKRIRASSSLGIGPSGGQSRGSSGSRQLQQTISKEISTISSNTNAVQKTSSEISSLRRSVSNLSKSISSLIIKLKSGSSVLKRATGGIVPGTGNRDTVPALLTPGEFVIRKDAVKAIGLNELHNLNKAGKGGRISKYARGGAVRVKPGTAGAITTEKSGIVTTSTIDKQDHPLLKKIRSIPIPDAQNISKIQKSSFFVSSVDNGVRNSIINITTDLLEEGAKKVSDTISSSLRNEKLRKIASFPSKKEVFRLFGGRQVAGQLFEAGISSFVQNASKLANDDFIDFVGGSVTSKDFQLAFKIPPQAYGVDAKFTTVRPLDLLKKIINYVSANPQDFNKFFQKIGSKQQREEQEANLSPREKKLLDFLKRSQKANISLAELRSRTGEFASFNVSDAKSLAKKGLLSPSQGGFILRNTGGPIPGSGSVDKVPALLTPGEFVINKRSASLIGLPRLKELNKLGLGGKVARFAKGGIVKGLSYFGNIKKYAEGGPVISNSAIRGGGLHVPKDQIGELNTLFGVLGENIAKSTIRLTAFAAAGKFVFALQTSIEGLVREVFELDQALTNLNKIFDLSKNEITKFKQELINLASSSATSINEVIDATTVFVQQGLSEQQTLKAVEASLLAVNAAGLKVAEATELLTVAVNSFGKSFDESIQIIDVLSKIADDTAASVQDLTTILQRAGSTAESFGLSLEQTASITSVLRETTRLSASTIGAAFKTILVNLQANEETLNKFGVATRDSNFELLNTFDILKNLSARVKELNTEQKNQLLTTISGKRRITELVAIVDNFSRVQEVLAGTSNAAGSAAAKQEKQLKTLSSGVTSIRVSISDLINAIFESGLKDLLSGAISGLGVLVSGFTSLTKALASIPGVIPIAAFAAFRKIGSKALNDLSQGIASIISNFTGLGNVITNFGARATTGLQSATAAFSQFSKNIENRLNFVRFFKGELEALADLGPSNFSAQEQAPILGGAINAAENIQPQSLEEVVSKQDELNQLLSISREILKENISEYKALKSAGEDLSEAEKKVIQALETEKSILDEIEKTRLQELELSRRRAEVEAEINAIENGRVSKVTAITNAIAARIPFGNKILAVFSKLGKTTITISKKVTNIIPDSVLNKAKALGNFINKYSGAMVVAGIAAAQLGESLSSLDENGDSILGTIGNFVSSLGEGVVTAASLGVVFKTIAVAIGGTVGAILGPISLVIAGIAGIISLFTSFSKKSQEQEEKLKKMQEDRLQVLNSTYKITSKIASSLDKMSKIEPSDPNAFIKKMAIADDLAKSLHGDLEKLTKGTDIKIPSVEKLSADIVELQSKGLDASQIRERLIKPLETKVAQREIANLRGELEKLEKEGITAENLPEFENKVAKIFSLIREDFEKADDPSKVLKHYFGDSEHVVKKSLTRTGAQVTLLYNKVIVQSREAVRNISGALSELGDNFEKLTQRIEISDFGKALDDSFKKAQDALNKLNKGGSSEFVTTKTSLQTDISEAEEKRKEKLKEILELSNLINKAAEEGRKSVDKQVERAKARNEEITKGIKLQQKIVSVLEKISKKDIEAAKNGNLEALSKDTKEAFAELSTILSEDLSKEAFGKLPEHVKTALKAIQELKDNGIIPYNEAVAKAAEAKLALSLLEISRAATVSTASFDKFINKLRGLDAIRKFNSEIKRLQDELNRDRNIEVFGDDFQNRINRSNRAIKEAQDELKRIGDIIKNTVPQGASAIETSFNQGQIEQFVGKSIFTDIQKTIDALKSGDIQTASTSLLNAKTAFEELKSTADIPPEKLEAAAAEIERLSSLLEELKTASKEEIELKVKIAQAEQEKLRVQLQENIKKAVEDARQSNEIDKINLQIKIDEEKFQNDLQNLISANKDRLLELRTNFNIEQSTSKKIKDLEKAQEAGLITPEKKLELETKIRISAIKKQFALQRKLIDNETRRKLKTIQVEHQIKIKSIKSEFEFKLKLLKAEHEVKIKMAEAQFKAAGSAGGATLTKEEQAALAAMRKSLNEAVNALENFRDANIRAADAQSRRQEELAKAEGKGRKDIANEKQRQKIIEEKNKREEEASRIIQENFQSAENSSRGISYNIEEAQKGVEDAQKNVRSALLSLIQAQNEYAMGIFNARMQASQASLAFEEFANGNVTFRDKINSLQQAFSQNLSLIENNERGLLEVRKQVSDQTVEIIKGEIERLRGLGRKGFLASSEELAQNQFNMAIASSLQSGQITPEQLAEMPKDIKEGVIEALEQQGDVATLDKIAQVGLERLGVSGNIDELKQEGKSAVEESNELMQEIAESNNEQVKTAMEQLSAAYSQLEQAKEELETQKALAEAAKENKETQKQVHKEASKTSNNTQKISTTLQNVISAKLTAIKAAIEACCQKIIAHILTGITNITAALSVGFKGFVAIMNNSTAQIVRAIYASAAGRIQNSASGSLSPSEISGLILAARREKSKIGSGANLVVANDKEVILTKDQFSKIFNQNRGNAKYIGNFQAGQKVVVKNDDTLASSINELKDDIRKLIDIISTNIGQEQQASKDINITFSSDKTIRLTGIDGLSNTLQERLKESLGNISSKEEVESLRDVVAEIVSSLQSRGQVGAILGSKLLG